MGTGRGHVCHRSVFDPDDRPRRVEALVVGHLLQPLAAATFGGGGVACSGFVLADLRRRRALAGFRVQSLATWLLVASIVVAGSWMWIHAAGIVSLSIDF
jgi:hypothetical protein